MFKFFLMIFLFFIYFLPKVLAKVSDCTGEEFDKKLSESLIAEVDKIKKKSVAVLTKELIEKEYKLKKMEADLFLRKSELDHSESEFDKKIKEFSKKQEDFFLFIEKDDKSKKERIDKLVSIVEGMKPDKAALLLASQDESVAVQILSLISPAKASKFFNLMPPATSAVLQKKYLDMKK